MRYVYKRSFLRALRHLDHTRQRHTERAIHAIIDFFQSGQKTEGLGLKQLHKPYWEIRAGLDIRVLFTLEDDLVSFVVAGNHDEIRRHLKRVR